MQFSQFTLTIWYELARLIKLMHKSVFYHWYKPQGYHRITCRSTHESDDTPGNKFIVCIYYTGEFLATATYDAAQFSRVDAEQAAIAWFGREVHPKLSYLP